ncbi:hypothetical protein [Nostoc sp. CALU 1950]
MHQCRGRKLLVKIIIKNDRLAENLKNNAIACCRRVSAIALQKTSKT